MANAIYPKFKEQVLQHGSNTNLSSDTVKLALIDLDAVGVTIATATNALPITIGTSTAHGLSNGTLVSISGVTGNTAANGLFKAANVTSTTFELTHYITGAYIAGNGSYLSGGRVVPLGNQQYLSDFPTASIIATSAALSGKTFTNGVFRASNVNFSAVAGAVSEALVLFVDTGSTATSPLVAFLDNGITGAPITPNGGDINVIFDASNGIFGL